MTKLLLVMKFTAILIMVACLQLRAGGYAQKISLTEKNTSLEKIFREVKKQSGYDFFYESKLLSDARKVDINVVNASIEQVMAICFNDQPLSFTIVEKTILVKKKIAAPVLTFSDDLPPPIIIRGRIVNEKSGEAVSDASVIVKGAQVGVNTNNDGEFSLSWNGRGNLILVVSHIGYADQEIAIKGDDYVTIKLVVAEQSLANVEISTGMYKRKKESFTGAVASFSGEQLRTIGNRNIIQSLKTLDPSFIVLENNRLGSNPNALPNIELRGKTSISTSTTELNSQYASDPNLPLFVLNGFPTTLQIINNLDMNRVASVTILKDAASTAIWGSKAANGVVVIETKRPVAGELRVTYTGDFIVDAPDLSSYNMMNAAEKLEFERLSGLYTNDNITTDFSSYFSEQKYNQRLAEIQSGVNTYWLAEPTQTAFTNKHSVQLSGGNSDLMFGAGLSYGNADGVMKGSERKTWGGNVDLSYRKGRLNITNQLYVTGYKSNESPYGNFSDFVQANPFLKKRNADGSIPKYADEGSGVFYSYNDPANGGYGGYTTPVFNPLYNASLFSVNRGENLDIINNIQGIYSLTQDLRIQGGFQLTNGSTSTTVFVSPENTSFIGLTPTERGSYTRLEQKQKGYNGNLTLTYAKVVGVDHLFNANVRGDITELSLRNIGFSAIGFPEGTNGNPAFAYKYDPYSKPTSLSSVVRSYSTTGILNYSYQMRFLLDAVYTLNGSNAFGSNNKTQPSWSLGLGWNLHKENIFKQYSWLNLLKIRANMGVSGNENLGTFSSNSVFTALAGSNMFGQSLDVISLGNPGLQWQNTKSVSTGIELSVLNNRISAIINYYNKTTDPLIVSATGILPSSAGLQFAYPVNVGKMAYKGWEANLRVSPVYKLKERIVWTINLTGSKVTGEYSNFGKALDAANKEQTQNRGLIRYMDGFSPDDIWAVVSRGIDPASGAELFVKKDGSETFAYNSDDIVRVGNSRPKVEGIIGSTFSYKGLYVGVALRYRVGGYQMNTSLYDKVENISFQGLRLNQDKRALYDRWQNVGDVSEFKGIGLTQYTPISSRFVQKDNHVIGESLSLGWDFLATSWIRKLNMQGLRIYAYTNDLFRATSIKTERGIEYPFARSFSLGLTASF